MDLSGLKWPLIIVLVMGLMYLFSEGGANFMFRKFTATPVDQQDADRRTACEAGLSRLGGFLLKTFRYEKAEEVLRTAVERYPEGNNSLYNQYRLAKCAEKLGRDADCVAILVRLRNMGAHQYDPRVPDYDVLNLRIDKLAGVSQLGETGKI